MLPDMDMPLISNPVSEYNKRETGAHVIVDSETALFYRLTRSAGIRRVMPADKYRSHNKYFTERDDPIPGMNRQDHILCRNPAWPANRSGIVTVSADRQTLSSDLISQNYSESQAPCVRGRTEWSCAARGQGNWHSGQVSMAMEPVLTQPGLGVKDNEGLRRILRSLQVRGHGTQFEQQTSGAVASERLTFGHIDRFFN